MRSYNDRKRKPQPQHIDMFFLLNQRKVITKKDFFAILPRNQYKRYVEAFYKRKINKVLSMFQMTDWFRERYIVDQSPKHVAVYERARSFIDAGLKVDITGRISDYNKKNILIKNVPDSTSLVELETLAKKALHFIEFNFFQLDMKASFERVGVVSIDGDLNEGCDFFESITDRNERITFDPVEFSEVKTKMANIKGTSHLEALKYLLLQFCEQYHLIPEPDKWKEFHDVVIERANESDDPTTFLMEVLRKVFYFCYLCYRQFDTVYDMILFCGDHHLLSNDIAENEVQSKVHSMKHTIYSQRVSFDYLKTKDLDTELDQFIIKEDSRRYKCDSCIKAFENEIFAKNHIKRKHPDVVGMVTERLRSFENFISNIDYFMFSCLSGTDNNHLPSFIDVNEKTDSVRYPECVFSGEIVIKR